jgi:effector-binding domain-containing protein
MACTVHIGNDLSLGRAHAALHRWMKDSAHQIIGPPRLVQLQRADQYITEVQFPVKVQGG